MIKGIIFANRTAFDGFQGAMFNYYKTKVKNVDLTVVKQWSLGINSTDDAQVLMTLDSRVLDYPSFNPHTVVDISISDPKWFPNPEI